MVDQSLSELLKCPRLDPDSKSLVSSFYQLAVSDCDKKRHYLFLKFLMKHNLLCGYNSMRSLKEKDNYKDLIKLYNEEYKTDSLNIKHDLHFRTALKATC